MFIFRVSDRNVQKMLNNLIYLIELYLAAVLIALEDYVSQIEQDEKFTFANTVKLVQAANQASTNTLQEFVENFARAFPDLSQNNETESWKLIGPKLLLILSTLFQLNTKQSICSFRDPASLSAAVPSSPRHCAPTSTGRLCLPVTLFQSKRINRTFCSVCRAAWQGHETGGQLPLGFGKVLLSMLTEFNFTPDLDNLSQMSRDRHEIKLDPLSTVNPMFILPFFAF